MDHYLIKPMMRGEIRTRDSEGVAYPVGVAFESDLGIKALHEALPDHEIEKVADPAKAKPGDNDNSGAAAGTIQGAGS